MAFSLTPFSSLGSNARLVIENINTASSKVYRLVSNKKILTDYSKLVKISHLVNKHSLVNVDFSTFCGFQTLAFGVQTNLGRAIPVWSNCLTYPILNPGSQNRFVLNEVQAFAKELGFYPKLVFDRGFWIPEMMKFFIKENITFYLRIKQGQLLKLQSGQRWKASRIYRQTKDAPIILFGCQSRLVISPPPPEHRGEKLQRWYILTNDFTSTRQEILLIYRHRFEIEETFKDLKHIFELDKFFIKKELTFNILLKFACLSFWLAFWCSLLSSVTSHPKKLRSFFKRWWEGVQRQGRQPLLKTVLRLESG